MNILITGGSGFIGSHLVEHYQDIADESVPSLSPPRPPESPEHSTRAMAARSRSTISPPKSSASPLIEHQPPRPGDVRHSLADVERLTATGWHPKHPLSEGLAETIRPIARLDQE